MSDLQFAPVGDERSMLDWQRVHNVVVPAAAMDLDEVRERVGRFDLEVAYSAGVLIGCTTVRPPAEAGGAVTVIARVLPEHRGQGFGAALYERGLGKAGEQIVETIVWASNVDGLRFAEKRGFVEVDRYLPEGEDVPYLTLRRSA